MTPSQMLKKVTEAHKAPSTGPIILLPRSPALKALDNSIELHYAEQTLALIQGRCPTCDQSVRILEEMGDRKVRYQCITGNPYHYFVRNL